MVRNSYVFLLDPIPAARKEWTYNKIKKLLAAGILVHSSSPYNTPVVVAPKPIP